MNQSFQVLVVEDDPVIASALVERLGREGYRSQWLDRGEPAISTVRSGTADLVLLDVMLPDIEGFAVCRAMREVNAQLPVIMITGRDSVADRVLGLNSGADDYVTKPFSLDELLARIGALFRRARPRMDAPVRFAHLSLDPQAMELRVGERRELLTVREFAVMEFLMKHPNQVLSRAEIYEGAWDQSYRGKSNMVDVYMNYLRNRTQAAGEPKVIHTVRGRGYILREPGEPD